MLFSDGAYEIRGPDGWDGTCEDFVRMLEAASRERRPGAQELRDLVMASSSSPQLADDLSIVVATLP